MHLCFWVILIKQNNLYKAMYSEHGNLMKVDSFYTMDTTARLCGSGDQERQQTVVWARNLGTSDLKNFVTYYFFFCLTFIYFQTMSICNCFWWQSRRTREYHIQSVYRDNRSVILNIKYWPVWFFFRMWFMQKRLKHWYAASHRKLKEEKCADKY